MDRTKLHTATCKAILDYIFLMGGWGKKNLGALGVRRGLADIDGFIRDPQSRLPVAFYIEVKTGDGRLSMDQETIRAEIVGRGGVYIEAHSVEDVEARLGELGLVLPSLLSGMQ